MSNVPPSSQRPASDRPSVRTSTRLAAEPATEVGAGDDAIDLDDSLLVDGGRLGALRERLRVLAPRLAYAGGFTTLFILCLYWTFPYDRVRDRIVAEFERGQVNARGPHQTLSIGSLSPSWLTGVVLRDVSLTTPAADPSRPPTVLRADELRVRIGLFTILSAAKDISFSANAMGGSLSGSVKHSPATTPAGAEPKPTGKGKTEAFDRTLALELADITLNEVAPLREAVGVPVGGTAKGSIDLVLPGGRADRANGTLQFDLDGFWVSDGKVPFKVPALRQVFGSDEITLPQMKIGALPVQLTVKNGVARIDKMEAKGGDLDVAVDGQISLREPLTDSELQINLRFKFNDSYRKKGEATSGLLLLLDSEPKLRAGKRPDGFYSLRIVGPIGGNLQVYPGSSSGAAR